MPNIKEVQKQKKQDVVKSDAGTSGTGLIANGVSVAQALEAGLTDYDLMRQVIDAVTVAETVHGSNNVRLGECYIRWETKTVTSDETFPEVIAGLIAVVKEVHGIDVQTPATTLSRRNQIAHVIYAPWPKLLVEEKKGRSTQSRASQRMGRAIADYKSFKAEQAAENDEKNKAELAKTYHVPFVPESESDEETPKVVRVSLSFMAECYVRLSLDAQKEFASVYLALNPNGGEQLTKATEKARKAMAETTPAAA